MKLSNINIDDFFKKDGGVKLQSFTDNLWRNKYQNKWWRTFFKVDDLPTPVQTDGSYIFKQIYDVAEGSPMLTAKAEWTQAVQNDTPGIEGIQGNLYHFGRGQSISLQQMAVYNRMKKEGKGQELVVKKYIQKVNALVEGGHSTLNNLTAQIMSKGYFDNKLFLDDGIKIKSNQCLTTDSFKKAGKKVWSDPTAKLYDFMLKAEKAFRVDNEAYYKGPLSWKMTRDTFNLLLKNEELKAFIGTFLTWNSGATALSVGQVPLTEVALNSWIRSLGGIISPIQIVEEEEIIGKPGQTLTENLNSYKKEVQGWEKNAVVLSPVTTNGIIKYGDVEEFKILQKTKYFNSASLEDGLFNILTYSNKQAKNIEDITELATTFAPVLSDYRAHWIFDVNAVGDNGWDLES